MSTIKIGERTLEVKISNRTIRDIEAAFGGQSVEVILSDDKMSATALCDFIYPTVKDHFTEDEFLENLGMFLGIASHHISDLCTPVHVGHKIDLKKVGSKSLARFHNKVERNMGRCVQQAHVRMVTPEIVKFSNDYFWTIK